MNDTTSFDDRWKALENMLQERFDKIPDLQAILFLIGVNEYSGRIPKIKFSKEQKQDLMHVAVCKLLSNEGYYQFEGFDEEGWPHYIEIKKPEAADLNAQEQLLKKHILQYFDL